MRFGANGGQVEIVVQVRDVTKFFGPLKVLDGVSLDVRQGQMVAIVGRSGSGKSTLLRCMNVGDDQGGESSSAAMRSAAENRKGPCCAATSAWCFRATICFRI